MQGYEGLRRPSHSLGARLKAHLGIDRFQEKKRKHGLGEREAVGEWDKGLVPGAEHKLMTTEQNGTRREWKGGEGRTELEIADGKEGGGAAGAGLMGWRLNQKNLRTSWCAVA